MYSILISVFCGKRRPVNLLHRQMSNRLSRQIGTFINALNKIHASFVKIIFPPDIVYAKYITFTLHSSTVNNVKSVHIYLLKTTFTEPAYFAVIVFLHVPKSCYLCKMFRFVFLKHPKLTFSYYSFFMVILVLIY